VAIERNEAKSRQIIIKYQSENIQGLNERALVTKANLALRECVNHTNNTEFISARWVREDTIKYEMNTAAGAQWIHALTNAKEFTE
jgi:hypothetical protein